MDSAQRRLVVTMPLHAITSTYGEEGLRERFAAEAASFPEPDQRRLNRALELAARLHAGDRREREPYLNHLLRVAIRIISHYRVRDTDVICAALLHDAVEDHPAELAACFPGGASAAGSAGAAEHGGASDDPGAALAALAAEFGPRVAELVAAVTNPQYAPERDANEQYREHVADSLRRSPWARVIKASDFTDNGAGLIHSTGARLGKLAGKYAPLVPVLRELIKLPDTPLDAAAKEHILNQLDRAAERFAAVLSSGEAHGAGLRRRSAAADYGGRFRRRSPVRSALTLHPSRQLAPSPRRHRQATPRLRQVTTESVAHRVRKKGFRGTRRRSAGPAGAGRGARACGDMKLGLLRGLTRSGKRRADRGGPVIDRCNSPYSPSPRRPYGRSRVAW